MKERARARKKGHLTVAFSTVAWNPGKEGALPLPGTLGIATDPSPHLWQVKGVNLDLGSSRVCCVILSWLVGKKKIEFKRNQTTCLEWLKSRVWLGPCSEFSCSFWKQMALEISSSILDLSNPGPPPRKTVPRKVPEKRVAVFWIGGLGGSASGALRNVRRTRPSAGRGVADQVFPGTDTGAVHAADLLPPRFGARLPSLLLQGYGQRLFPSGCRWSCCTERRVPDSLVFGISFPALSTLAPNPKPCPQTPNLQM